MNTIDKTRLVQTSVESLLRDTAPAQKKAESAQSGGTAGAEAVKVDAGFGSGAASDPKKIATLQQQISSGQYNPDLNAVATALARDLL
jgi:anti-sigma28 factor (negative regulator of flagellin synthesis)